MPKRDPIFYSAIMPKTPTTRMSSTSGAWKGVVLSGFALMAAYGAACTAVAGDLLRGGYTMGSQSTSASPDAIIPASASQALKNAQDVLARTTQAINAVNAMQAAGRKLALSGGNSGLVNPANPSQTLPVVPNGLVTGGLVPATGATANSSLWSNANLPSQTVSNGKTTVTIVQNSQDAVLTWNTFNIGSGTTLDFNQNKGGSNVDSWIAFNIVDNPNAVPTQILGAIKAPGQVYVIDQNGIIFGGASQINVHTLVASSLPIDTYLIGHGLLNNPDDQFLFSALAQPAGSNGSPAMAAATGNIGDVTVEAGAQITAPSNAASVGGRVALIGPDVTNDGTISTPDGQTILAAGLQVGFAASSDPTLRGLDTYVGAVSGGSYPSTSTAGVVTNDGSILVPGGDAMMVGANVNQMGVIASTTTVTLNGRIDLDASYNSISTAGNSSAGVPFLAQSTGDVVLGNDSVTQILPDWNSDATVTLSQFTLSSLVNVRGLAINMAGGSTLFAPGGTVNFDAGTWDYLVSGGVPESTFVRNTGQIYLDSGATVDVQGSWDISEPVSQNIVSVQLLGPELADSPLQRDGVFEGQTIYVDIRDSGYYDGQFWQGTPLADTSGYISLIQYNIGELTTAGGTVNMDAGGSVVMQNGSQVNVSGGWIDYQGGEVQVSEVVTDGHIYPINEATPDLVYAGFNLGTFTVSAARYGLSQIYTDPLITNTHYEQSYVEGFGGGTLSVIAPSTALQGSLLGLTVTGARQLVPSDAPASTPALDTSAPPTPSQFNLTYAGQTASGGVAGPAAPAVPPDIVFSPQDDLPAPAPFSLDSSGAPAALSGDLQKNVVLSPDLVGSDGFGAVNISDGNGNITVPAGVTLKTEVYGSITLAGANVNIQGSLITPSGAISLTAYDFDSFIAGSTLSGTPPFDPSRGKVTLGASAVLNTAGAIVDDRPYVPGADTQPVATAGGSVSIDSLDINLESGSVIDVSGGVEMQTSGSPAYGDAGSISILGGQDPDVATITGGDLIMDATLLGYSGAAGGSLSIRAPLIQVGGVASQPETLLLSPGFFSQGGFENFTLTGIGVSKNNTYSDFYPAIDIAPGVQIDPVITSAMIVPDTEGSSLALQLTTLPVGERPPVNLTFNATGLQKPTAYTDSDITLLARGDILMGAGSVIQTDPYGSIVFNGQTVAILGSVFAPGGSISVSGVSDSVGTVPFFGGSTSDSLVTVDLGPASVLSTAGTTISIPDIIAEQTYNGGTVTPGGSISVSGNIFASAGAVMDVSGATATLDVSPYYSIANGNSPANTAPQSLQNGSLQGLVPIPTRVDSNGGTITLTGGEVLFNNATMLGQAGGPSAVGGTLIISNALADARVLPNTPTLTVTQKNPQFSAPGEDAIGQTVTDANGNAVTQTGYFGVNSFTSGGFSSLTLQGAVLFQGPVTINATGALSIASGGVIEANAPVTLKAPFVELGQPFIQPLLNDEPYLYEGSSYNFTPTYGTGSLTVIANLIDVGNLSLLGIGNADFIAHDGAIQGDGTLDIAGQVTMAAGQIFPPTETTFTIAAYDYVDSNGKSQPGTVTFIADGSQETPLSAGGTLDVYASVINQDGVLRAPGGTINLGWNGTGADPLTGSAYDASQKITLSAGSITSVSMIDSITGQPIEVPYGINYNGTAWIDPGGVDITAVGAPVKAINISATSIDDQKGSTIDIRGGGDLLSYQFVPGILGSTDILASDSSFAIIPGYEADYAPYASYNTSSSYYDTGDPGYTNSNLEVGQQVYLNAEGSLAAGVYTLLPARYALLPGAYLVTPLSGAPTGQNTAPNGSYVVSGYEFSAYQTGRTAQPLLGSFQVQSSAVYGIEAQYNVSLANQFLASAGARLPKDSGQLVLNATQAMSIQGALQSQSVSGGLGGLVDINTPANIFITGAQSAETGAAPAGSLVLDAAELSSFGAASLLIGGTRDIAGNQATVDVATDSITVDNAGEALTGQDIILASNGALTVDPGAEIASSGASSNAEAITVAGDGTLLRISNDPSASFARTGVTSSAQPQLSVGAGATFTGVSLTLDSSGAATLDPAAVLHVGSVALDAGNITVELTDPGSVPAGSGLVLSGNAFQSLLSSAQSVSLLSYGAIDFYGSGALGAIGKDGQASLENLALNAAEILGFNTAGGSVTVNAQNILLGNASNATGPAPAGSGDGTLQFNAGTVQLGANQIDISQFTSVNITAANGIIANASGELSVTGPLTIAAPLITAAKGASGTIASTGDLSLGTPAKGSATVTGGFGATLDFIGASIEDDTAINLPSGNLTMEATAGDLQIADQSSAVLDVAGQARAFFDTTEYTSGGTIQLTSEQGNISIGSGASLSVAAQSGGGNAGTLSVTLPDGTLLIDPKAMIDGAAGAGYDAGSFSLSVGSLASLSTIDAILNNGGFTYSRSYEVQSGDVAVDGNANAWNYSVVADGGDITVSGGINASDQFSPSGLTGGSVTLQAQGSVIVANGATITVAAKDTDSAGQGGSVDLEAGSDVNGVASTTGYVDIQAGSTIDLSVANTNPGLGQLAGTLHIRAPQIGSQSDPTGVQVGPIDGAIIGASGITVEGYTIYNTASDNGSINDQETNIYNNGAAFASAGNTASISGALLANNSGLASILSIVPGAEIINPTGDLTLASSFDLSTYRFGPDNVAGVLTLRAAGNIVLDYQASLTDGFQSDAYNALMLAAGSASWSYRITAGANFDSANYGAVEPLTTVGTDSGSLLLGQGAPALPTSTESTRSTVINTYFQTIRTGVGSISINTANNVELLNPMATIYTAGTQAPGIANFTEPQPNTNSQLGSTQAPFYTAQYSYEGGNLTINAQNNIEHVLMTNSGLVVNSSLEMPSNWLYFRGDINSANGQFAAASNGSGYASTSWWIDYSNFVEGVGAMGGGNVTLDAGNDIINVDAVIPTNGRMPEGAPSLASLVELGGGDLTVRAGDDISGGVYYVERGNGVLQAGNQILTNQARAALLTNELSEATESTTWLPTTLFLGSGSFDVTAGGGVLLSSVVNPFLLPDGVDAGVDDKTTFSTYALDDSVNISSLSGDVTIRSASGSGDGTLEDWYQYLFLYYQNPESYAHISEPWLRLNETNLSVYTPLFSLTPGTLRITAFSGDINFEGDLTLSPSPTGTLDLLAAGSINGMQPVAFDPGLNGLSWQESYINISDADPALIPGPASPLGDPVAATSSLLDSLDDLFAASGSIEGYYSVLQTQEELHAPGLLHAGDTTPSLLYAGSGSISGLTLYSPTVTQVIADQDITDDSFYIQNDNASDISIVSAGLDIIPYDPDSPLRTEAQTGNNTLNGSFSPGDFQPGTSAPNAGDIQIAGPGTLEVLAGRNLTLGVGPNGADGTATGITSIGNQANPFLPFTGAQIIVAAGLGGAATGLDGSTLDWESFDKSVLESADGDTYFTDLATTENFGISDYADYEKLTKAQRAIVGLDLFYLVLRDAGRNHNVPASTGYGNYAAGYAAIQDLIGSLPAASGNIDLTSKELQTDSGGDIDVFDPSGMLTVGVTIVDQPVDQGILTEYGGNISIYTEGDVTLGTSRIFTLRGGNIVIWSNAGNIAAGESSKTVAAAPPTRVIVDPQSGNVETDLSGLATGGGIGVLATVAGVAPGDVDLIAPVGVIDAGDAGIRSTGNLNLAAVQILNASNIVAGGASTGVPTVTVAAPNLGALSAASGAAGAGATTANQQTQATTSQSADQSGDDSVIDVSVLGYGGGDSDSSM
jgi:filamentous hemagglutinin family protein